MNSLFCLPSEGFASGSADGTICLWDSGFSFVTQLDLRKSPDGYPALQVRSVCWDGGRLLAGTRDSEVFQVSLQNRDSPACVMQVGGAWMAGEGRGGEGRGGDGRGGEGRAGEGTAGEGRAGEGRGGQGRGGEGRGGRELRYWQLVYTSRHDVELHSYVGLSAPPLSPRVTLRASCGP